MSGPRTSSVLRQADGTLVARFFDLSHTIEDGLVTYPGLPPARITDHLTREESRGHYAEGVEFHIGAIEMVANTGTYLDVPAHRFEGAMGLEELPLDRVADVPGVCVDVTGGPVDARHVPADVAGKAVLFHTGWSRHWATPEYGRPGHPYVTEAAVRELVAGGAAIVGIDSVNIDDTSGGWRPAHSELLARDILIVEHLTGLAQLVGEEFTFTAVPVKAIGLGTWPVRAFARLS